jgi:hypothetical protein
MLENCTLWNSSDYDKCDKGTKSLAKRLNRMECMLSELEVSLRMHHTKASTRKVATVGQAVNFPPLENHQAQNGK